MHNPSTIADVLHWLETRPDIQTIRAAVCDLNGVMRGKRIPVDQARKVMENTLRMPLSVVGLDIWGGDIDNNPMVFNTGDVDGIGAWTGRGILPVEWTAHPTAFLPVWLQNDAGVPYLADPRRALAAVLARYAALGLTPMTAVELEFHLVDASGDIPKGAVSPTTGRNLDTAAAMAMEEVDQFEAYFHEVYAACRQQDIPVDTTIAENGSGQFEINLGHLPDALRAADDAVFFKRTVKGIARKHGFAASFMAKPYGNFSGNGLHIHMSLLDREGKNVFDDGTDRGTDMMRHAVGGLLAGMAESTLIFAPHYNSYRRLRPNSYAPTAVAWGYENRMVAIRIPGGSYKARRIEHRVAGADANPYLVMAVMLGAALIGIERTMAPGEPRLADAYANDLPKLPNSWRAAADAFEAGPMMAEIFDPELIQSLLACKRQEMDIFAAHVSPFEYRTYLEAV
ncbi:glutamine synthetase family protein [Devosia lacusdianchii]|uniref:glutamine synthetase family protein n=1 Tax=Devosia lacusdianchii TaxID=2917991 RepID=UPI001F0566DA|nr:glutamine synthetase family protein [Devosia sp. JXJ CY 41]